MSQLEVGPRRYRARLPEQLKSIADLSESVGRAENELRDRAEHEGQLRIQLETCANGQEQEKNTSGSRSR